MLRGRGKPDFWPAIAGLLVQSPSSGEGLGFFPGDERVANCGWDVRQVESAGHFEFER